MSANGADSDDIGDGRPAVLAPPALPRSMHPGATIPITAYHFCMLADTIRNQAYRSAIERAVGNAGKGCRVLDIGCGTGLLGLIASRAGAGEVTCVEMNPVLAATAKATLAASGVTTSGVGSSHSSHSSSSRTATVVHAMSTEMPIDECGVDGPRGPADVIVSEILDAGLVGEGVLHTMRDANARLLKPGGALVPKGAQLFAMAIELMPPEVGDDIDLSCLDFLRRGVSYTSMRLHTMGHARLSQPMLALDFDFYVPTPLGEDGRTPVDREARLSLPVLRRGRCNAIVWWFDLLLDDTTTLSVAPGAPVRTWKQNITHLQQPFDVTRGDTIEVLAWTSADNQIHVAGGTPGTVQRPEMREEAVGGGKIRIEQNFDTPR